MVLDDAGWRVLSLGEGREGGMEDAVVKATMKFRAERLLVFQNRALIRPVIYVKIQEFI